jgi:hypothetical protein
MPMVKLNSIPPETNGMGDVATMAAAAAARSQTYNRISARDFSRQRPFAETPGDRNAEENVSSR